MSDSFSHAPAAQRAQAARALAAVARGRSLDEALPATADAFTRALVYGVLRDRRRLEALLTPLLRHALAADSPLKALLLAGLYQLQAMDLPAHAAVNETVEAVALIGEPRARGLVNAVLRRFQREAPALIAALPGSPGIRHSHPDWLVTALAQDWGPRAEAILAANNQQGPMTLRVNRRRRSPEAYQRELAQAGLAAEPVAGLPDALMLHTPVPVERLPGFLEGWVSVQDASAQLAADLLDLAPTQRVLDACAAPGGKTAHALERTELDLLALDRDGERLKRVEDTLSRLGLAADCRCTDAAEPGRWWDGRPFDRILIDAPCSGTGVIRRHPDIKWLRRARDITTLAQGQQRLLDALWPLLAPGGLLVYATCSTLSAEGEAVVANFLAHHPDARALAVPAPVGLATRHGLRIPPGGAFDGFIYARLRKHPQARPAGVG